MAQFGGGVGWGGVGFHVIHWSWESSGTERKWLLIEVRKAADCSWTIKRGRLS